jgi:hypothetical protein
MESRSCGRGLGYDNIVEGEQQSIGSSNIVFGEQELWKRFWLW